MAIPFVRACLGPKAVTSLRQAEFVIRTRLVRLDGKSVIGRKNSFPSLTRLGPARLRIGIPLIEAMQTRYSRREYFFRDPGKASVFVHKRRHHLRLNVTSFHLAQTYFLVAATGPSKAVRGSACPSIEQAYASSKQHCERPPHEPSTLSLKPSLTRWMNSHPQECANYLANSGYRHQS
jgi:hypothetical protein